MKPQKYFERNADDDTSPHNEVFQDNDDNGGYGSTSEKNADDDISYHNEIFQDDDDSMGLEE